MPSLHHSPAVMPLASCALVFISFAACGVGGVGQTTTSAVQPAQTTQQQAGSGTAGNTTGAVDATGDSAATGGTTTAEQGATTSETTAGESSAGASTGTTTGATTAGDTNATTSQNGNTTLYDLTGATYAFCTYDTTKGVFALSLSNDPQFCAHGAAGIRMMADHDLAMTADLTKQQTSSGNANNANTTSDANTTLTQPKNPMATLSLYTSSCTLTAQATSVSGSVTLTQADSATCSGSFSLSLVQTAPTLGMPTTVTGSFVNAAACTTLTTNTTRNTCQ